MVEETLNDFIDTVAQDTELTRRQAEVSALSELDIPTTEISDILGDVTNKTISNHKSAVLRKIDAVENDLFQRIGTCKIAAQESMSLDGEELTFYLCKQLDGVEDTAVDEILSSAIETSYTIVIKREISTEFKEIRYRFFSFSNLSSIERAVYQGDFGTKECIGIKKVFEQVGEEIDISKIPSDEIDNEMVTTLLEHGYLDISEVEKTIDYYVGDDEKLNIGLYPDTIIPRKTNIIDNSPFIVAGDIGAGKSFGLKAFIHRALRQSAVDKIVFVDPFGSSTEFVSSLDGKQYTSSVEAVDLGDEKFSYLNISKGASVSERGESMYNSILEVIDYAERHPNDDILLVVDEVHYTLAFTDELLEEVQQKTSTNENLGVILMGQTLESFGKQKNFNSDEFSLMCFRRNGMDGESETLNIPNKVVRKINTLHVGDSEQQYSEFVFNEKGSDVWEPLQLRVSMAEQRLFGEK